MTIWTEVKRPCSLAQEDSLLPCPAPLEIYLGILYGILENREFPSLGEDEKEVYTTPPHTNTEGQDMDPVLSPQLHLQEIDTFSSQHWFPFLSQPRVLSVMTSHKSL